MKIRLLLLPILLLGLTACLDDTPSDQAETNDVLPEAFVSQPADTVPLVSAASFLFLSDIHLNTQANRTIAKDDTGTDLWGATKTRLQTLMASADAPSFIVYTGDLTAHSYQEGSHKSLSPDDLHDNMEVVLKDLYEIAGDTPLFYAPGNNDALGGDYYEFANYRGETPFGLVDSAAMQYPAPNAQMESLPHPGQGYYSARPFPGLRVIALNSVILGHNHWSATFQNNYVAQGDTMMAWLGEQLTDVRASGEKAYLTMHIPPGTDAHSNTPMWDTVGNSRWQQQFLALADTFQHEITGILYGHTHMDEIRLLCRPGTTDTIVTEVAISAPGISPNHGQNPAFRTVSYDPSSFELTGYTTYHTDLSSTVWGDGSYTFNDSYHCNSATIDECLKSLPYQEIAKSLEATYLAGKDKVVTSAREGLWVMD